MDVTSLNEANEYILNEVYPMLAKNFNIISLKWVDEYDIGEHPTDDQYMGTFIRFELSIVTSLLLNIENSEFCNIELEFYYNVDDHSLLGSWPNDDEPTEQNIYKYLDKQCIKLSLTIDEYQIDLDLLKSSLHQVHSKINFVRESYKKIDEPDTLNESNEFEMFWLPIEYKPNVHDLVVMSTSILTFEDIKSAIKENREDVLICLFNDEGCFINILSDDKEIVKFDENNPEWECWCKFDGEWLKTII